MWKKMCALTVSDVAEEKKCKRVKDGFARNPSFLNLKQKVNHKPDSSPPSSVLRRFRKPFKFAKRDVHTPKETHIQVQVITRDKCSAIRSRAIFGVASISRLLKMIGLFCRISSLL